MKIGKRSAMTSIGLALVIAAASLAQDPVAKKNADKSEAGALVKKKNDPSRRVPDYFGQIGLSIEQREAIYKIRKAHHDKIDALKKQILDQEAGSMKECEALLTDTQKKLLEHLRSDGVRAAVPKPADAPAKK